MLENVLAIISQREGSYKITVEVEKNLWGNFSETANSIS